MENSAKALYMAGTLLISLLVISLFVYSYRNWGGVQKQKDKIAQEENITKFNREYEAFNKRIMYGVDVISCINKAVSNNEKYMKQGNWAISGASGEEALIQVVVKLKNELKESYQMYYINDDNKESKFFTSIEKSLKEEIKKSFKSTDSFISLFEGADESKLYSNLKYKKIGETILSGTGGFNPSGQETMNISEREDSDGYKYIYLLKNETKNGDIDYDSVKKSYTKFNSSNTNLYTLASNANNMELIAYNETEYKAWSTIKWTTALGDFKKRKFKCEDFSYNEATGRVDKLIFTEQ